MRDSLKRLLKRFAPSDRSLTRSKPSFERDSPTNSSHEFVRLTATGSLPSANRIFSPFIYPASVQDIRFQLSVFNFPFSTFRFLIVVFPNFYPSDFA